MAFHAQHIGGASGFCLNTGAYYRNMNDNQKKSVLRADIKRLGLRPMDGNLFEPGAAQAYRTNLRKLKEQEDYFLSKVTTTAQEGESSFKLVPTSTAVAATIAKEMKYLATFTNSHLWTADDASDRLEAIERQYKDEDPGWERIFGLMYTSTYGPVYRQNMRRILQALPIFETGKSTCTLLAHFTRVREYADSAGMSDEEIITQLKECTTGTASTQLRTYFDNNWTLDRIASQLKSEDSDELNKAVARVIKGQTWSGRRNLDDRMSRGGIYNVGEGSGERDRDGTSAAAKAGPNDPCPTHRNRKTGRCNHTLAQCYSQGGAKPTSGNAGRDRGEKRKFKGDRDSEEKPKFKGCYLCREEGHQMRSCPLRERVLEIQDQEKKKKSGGSVNAVNETTNTDVNGMAVDLPAPAITMETAEDMNAAADEYFDCEDDETLGDLARGADGDWAFSEEPEDWAD